MESGSGSESEDDETAIGSGSDEEEEEEEEEIDSQEEEEETEESGSGEEEEEEEVMVATESERAAIMAELRAPPLPDGYWPRRQMGPRRKPEHVLVPAYRESLATLRSEALALPLHLLVEIHAFFEKALSLIPVETPLVIPQARSLALSTIDTFVELQTSADFLCTRSILHSLFLKPVLLLAKSTFLIRYMHLYNFVLAHNYPSLMHHIAQRHPCQDFLVVLNKLSSSSALVELGLSHLKFYMFNSPRPQSHILYEDALALLVGVRP